jgi:hypothetical protein
MKRAAALLLFTALLTLQAAGTHGQEAGEEGPRNPNHTWYAQALARGAAGLNVTHFWSRGPLLRAETVVAGHKVVTIVNGPWYYAYDGLTGLGLAIKRDARAIAKDRPDRRPFGQEYELLVGQGAELIREEDLAGRKAGVFRVTDQLGKRELWTTLDELHLPLRIEIYDRRTAQRRYTDYLNWQSGLSVPRGFFEPPPNITLDRLEFAEYLKRTREVGPVGPVPILYTNLLHVRRNE